MAHLLFDSLTGVSVDNQTALTVQSLLDPLSLPGESLSGSSVSPPQDAVTLDDEDVFQCGKCKKQFTSFTLFMAHKKEHVPGCSAGKMSPDFSKEEGALALTLETEFQQQDGEGNFAQLEVHAFEGDCCEVGQPIILSEADILNLGIDQASLTITTSSQDFPSLSSVIQSGTYLTSPVTSAPSLKGITSSETNNNFNVTTMDGQPVILAASDLSESSFITPDIIPQHDNINSGVSGGKRMLEFGNTETSLELLDPETVQFATEQDLQQTLQSATEPSNQNTVVDNAQPNPANVPSLETANENQRPALKSMKLKCCFCSKMFSKNFDLQQHLRSHTGEKPFQCVVCGRAFSQKSNVKKHMATHKVWPKDMSSTLPKEPLQPVAENSGSNDGTNDAEVIVDRSYVCQYCSSRFQSYCGLKTHMKTHSNQKVYKCIQKNCNQTFSDLDAFVLHSRFHSSEVQYRCHICNTQFCDLRELGLHQYNHNGIHSKKTARSSKTLSQYFQCSKCKSRFATIEALEHHISSTSHSYPCPRCGKVFICERYLRRHLATHGASASFRCQQCGKGFRTEQYLNTHMLTHSTLKPFSCSHCSAAFNRKDKLVRHSFIHQSVKRFKCPFRSYLGCLKEFNRQDKLKLHILTHNSATSLQCKVCNRTFQKQSLLQQHEKAHHQGAPYLCHQCGMAFKKKVSLGTHICSFQDKSYGQEEANKAKRARLQHRSARRSVKRAWATRKKKQSRANSEKSVPLDPPDNVPTIEIIVMPVPVSPRSATGAANEQGGLYHVVFPSAEVSVESNTILQPEEQLRQEQQFFQHNQESRYDQEVPVASTLM